ncbi:hypothetical protein OHB13_36755 [Streptomyces sp. NBC_00440]|nr:hypothetical protein OG221_00590 [Streptomyces sp. NBC_00932]
MATSCGQRNPDDKLDQAVGGQVGARRSPPLGLGKKISRRAQDQPMTVEPQRDRSSSSSSGASGSRSGP